MMYFQPLQCFLIIYSMRVSSIDKNCVIYKKTCDPDADITNAQFFIIVIKAEYVR